MDNVSKTRVRISNSAPGVFRVEGVARMLNCTEEFVRTLLRSGELRGFKIGQQWRITEQAIRDFIEQGEEAVSSHEYLYR